MGSVFGVFGLLLSCILSDYYHKKGSVFIDCYLLSIGFFGSGFFIYLYIYFIEINIILTIVIYSLVVISFNFVWVVFANLLLDVVDSPLRSTANALSICCLHLFGDSGSPYWVGLINDACLNSNPFRKNTIDFLLNCTRISFYPLSIVSFVAGSFSLFTSLTYLNDKID